MITLLCKKLDLLRLDGIFNLEREQISLTQDNLPDKLFIFFTPVNQVHCHATCSATKGA